MSSPTGRPPIEPGPVWFVDFDPARGREQGKDRPALVVSSRFHAAGCTESTQRPARWIITEQVRTVSVTRFHRYAPEITLSGDEVDDVRTSARSDL